MTLAAGRPHRIVIVGGGAGGLELATRLGDTLVKRGRAEVTPQRSFAFGLDRIDADKGIRIIVIEAADRIVPALPERLSKAALDTATRLMTRRTEPHLKLH